jgi:error-prone DNA polymerase
VGAVDVRYSDWDCTLEPAADGRPRLRLGLRLIKGLAAAAAQRLVEARCRGPWASLADLRQRCALDRRALKALAAADALAGLAGNRHRAGWLSSAPAAPLPLLPLPEDDEALPLLPPPGEGEAIVADHARLGLSLRRHPLALLRAQLTALEVLHADAIARMPPGSVVRTAGLAITRQRPASAKQVTFVTLEDETGQLNLVVWRRLAARRRSVLLGARLLGALGEVQRESGVTHLVARELIDYSGLLGQLLGGLAVRTRDFH